MRPGGRLDNIATLLGRAGSFPVTLGIGPETLSIWQSAAHANPTFAPGFQRVRTAATRASTQLLPEPYVPVAAPTLEAEGLGAQLPPLYVAGSNAIDAATGQIPDPRTVFADPVDAASIGQLTQMSASRFVVRDAALVPVAEPLTPAQPFELTTGSGPAEPAAASDSGLESLMSSSGPPTLREQRVIAALAEIAYEAPSQPRGVVIATPADWSPDVATVTLLLHDLARYPLVEPATLDMLFAEVPPVQSNGATLQRQLAPISARPQLPLRADEYNRAVSDLKAYQAMIGRNDPSIAAGRHSLLLSLSTANTRADALAHLATITTDLDALTQRHHHHGEDPHPYRAAGRPAPELPEQHRARRHSRAGAPREPEVDLPQGRRLPTHAAARPHNREAQPVPRRGAGIGNIRDDDHARVTRRLGHDRVTDTRDDSLGRVQRHRNRARPSAHWCSLQAGGETTSGARDERPPARPARVSSRASTTTGSALSGRAPRSRRARCCRA